MHFECIKQKPSVHILVLNAFEQKQDSDILDLSAFERKNGIGVKGLRFLIPIPGNRSDIIT